MSFNTKTTDAEHRLKRNLCLCLICGLMAVIAFCFILYFSIGRATIYVPENTDNRGQEVRFHINSTEHTGKRLTLTGWAFLPGEDIVRFKTHILLRSEYSEQYIKLPTSMHVFGNFAKEVEDSDIEVTHDYSKSGWVATVNKGRLNHPLEQYEIVILYQNNDNYFLVETGKHLEAN